MDRQFQDVPPEELGVGSHLVAAWLAAVVPELDKVIANLELMPLRLNSSKKAKLGERQMDYARKFHAAGLITSERLNEILRRKPE